MISLDEKEMASCRQALLRELSYFLSEYDNRNFTFSEVLDEISETMHALNKFR